MCELALNRYLDQTFRERIWRLEPSLPPREAIVAFMQEFFFRCVSKGQKNRTISKAYSAEDLSKSLLGALLGIRVLARVRPERKLLEGLLRPIFGLLDDT